MAKTRSSSQVSRRDVLSVGAVMTGIGVASVAVPAGAFADGEEEHPGHRSDDVAVGSTRHAHRARRPEVALYRV
jgi:hypothetical protein